MESTRHRPRGRSIVVVAVVILIAAWAHAARAHDAPAATDGVAMQATAESLPRVSYVGRFTLTPAHGRPGTVVGAAGAGLPADTELELVWTSVRGTWITRGEHHEEFHGRRFDPISRVLGRVRTDAGGGFQTTITAPEDYGFLHDVRVVQDGVVRNQAAFSIDMHATIVPAGGPPGTPIEIRLEGVGWQSMENSWMVVYDNRFTGWLSAVTTAGVARATIPAVGGPGKHIIQIVHGSFTVPYLNMQQSPRPERPTFAFEFAVTPGEPVLPLPAGAQRLPVETASPPVPEVRGPALWTDVVSGSVGTPIRLHGRGFPPGRAVDFAWTTVTGNRVSGDGWSPSVAPLFRGVADAHGNVTLALEAPEDLGGPHDIVATVGEARVATRFTVTPSALPLDRTSGPTGTTFWVHLKGVGWTETANIYHLVYDNAYLGYACGFNSQGDVRIPVVATGGPGWHFVDVYPGIYKGRDAPGVQNFRIPQLTYAADHPGERLPAFRFAFYVTE